MIRVRYSPVQLARMLGTPEPTPEQAAVIGAPLEPMAVIAGAGSGKSETMAARLVWLVANQLVTPDRVLGLTFTRKAAAELAGRVRAQLAGLRRAGLPTAASESGPPLLSASQPGLPGLAGGELAGLAGGELAGDPVVCTYHAYAGRLVSDHALREGLEPSLRLITPAVAWQLAARVVAAYEGPMDSTDWTPATVTAAVLTLAGELAEHLRDAADVIEVGRWLTESTAALDDSARVRRPGTGQAHVMRAAVRDMLRCQRTREQLLPLVAEYASAKAGREVIDYGDQMAIAARIASRHPAVGQGERVRYQAVLLDEYQDTSYAQLVLLAALFGGGHPVTAVGDPCQSIYGWRGASAGNLRRFPADFPVAVGRPAAVQALSTSFRNTGRVLHAAGAIQAELRAAAPDVPALQPPQARAHRGLVRCALLESAEAEAAWVADQVVGLLRLRAGLAPDGRPWDEPSVQPGRARKLTPRDVAVLCRKRAQFPVLRAALEARGVPVEVVGLGGLLTVPEVSDIVATLQVMHDPTASGALARLLVSPRWRIGPADLVALGRRARILARLGQHGGGQHGGGQHGGDEPGGDQSGGDLVAAAVSDLTREQGSLVEALDDLGDPGAYTAAGYARLSELGVELRMLRGHAARPLAELVTEVERTLGLDVEVAARPGTDPAAARADLDAFTDAAAAFAGDAHEPTLGAFLAYLAAAESEEFGLEAGQVGETDSVKLATVHAAKGLQWPAVVLPGLAEGPQRHMFPAKPRVSTRWTENPRLLPFSLRGDAADLPELVGLQAAQVDDFNAACTARDLAEERRLCYVAATRAAYWLACSGYWWSSDGVSRLGPSLFLAEMRVACEDGAGEVDVWQPEPAADAENPAMGEPATATWPAAAASGARYEAVREAGELVLAASRERGETESRSVPADPGNPHAPLLAAWARDTDLLLAERAERRAGQSVTVSLPRRLSVSSLVTIAQDPAELAQSVRRPMPRPPAPQATRGTAFHEWLEQRFGQAQLIDADELPGAADDDSALAGDPDAVELRAAFEAGDWADRWPLEVEVPFETLVGDRIVRGRIDAVFADAADGGYDVVDWKTGRQPRSAAEKRAVAVQLAAYRLAWAALTGVPVEDVRAAFYYVRDNATVRPADLLDARGLAGLVEDIEVAGQRYG
jgi:DNA helicase II / ATP-dependent DNA helicase PcrA